MFPSADEGKRQRHAPAVPLDEWATHVRYRANGRGHYESFYLKGNHPSRRLGVWLKFNILEPVGNPEQMEGELWGVWFDGETGQHAVAGCVVPANEVKARFGETAVRIRGAMLELGPEVVTEQADVHSGGHHLTWEVRLHPLAKSVVHYPFPWLYTAPFPRKKVLTPIPRGRLEGWIEVDGILHRLDGWEGLHGHNWGREHALRYAYGNGGFDGGAYLDGFTAQLQLGRRTSPWLSMLVVRLPDGRELQFNHPLRWAQGKSAVEHDRWTLDVSGPVGTRAQLSMETKVADMVGLRYRYPDGRVGWCLNTKFAIGRLRIEERGSLLYEGDADSCELETFGPSPRADIDYNAQ
jgi:hypothetical protein